ncbi:MAG: response regulator [Thermodesulfobacteriota bacterium]
MTTVLIVDDEIDFAETLAERLSLRNIEARVATGAEEAMALLQQDYRPDAILLDLKMPGMDGLQTLAAIKKHDPSITVIMVTGHGSTSAGMEGMRLGLAEYLLKPVDIGVIVDRIEQAAKGR